MKNKIMIAITFLAILTIIATPLAEAKKHCKKDICERKPWLKKCQPEPEPEPEPEPKPELEPEPEVKKQKSKKANKGTRTRHVWVLTKSALHQNGKMYCTTGYKRTIIEHNNGKQTITNFPTITATGCLPIGMTPINLVA